MLRLLRECDDDLMEDTMFSFNSKWVSFSLIPILKAALVTYLN